MLHYIFNKHETICFASFVLCCFKFLCSRAYKKISCLFYQEARAYTDAQWQRYSFFRNTLTKTMDKNKGRPTSLPMRRVNRQVQNWAIRLKNSSFGVSNLSFCLCLLLIFSVCTTSFYLWDHRIWLTGEYTVWWVYHSNLGWSPKKRTIRKRTARKTLHYVWCTDHRDPLGTRTQDPYIKSVLLYQLS